MTVIAAALALWAALATLAYFGLARRLRAAERLPMKVRAHMECPN